MDDDSRRRTITRVGGLSLALVLLACAGIVWLGPVGVAPRLAAARAGWEAQGIRSYRLTARWTYGTIVNRWTIEVRDGRVVSGFDERFRKPLSRGELLLAERTLTVDVLFASVADELRPTAANTPRTILASALAPISPQARDAIDRCAARFPSVEFHPALSYPTGITVHGSPCYRASEWTVLVTDLAAIR